MAAVSWGDTPPYLRVLGATAQGRILLRQMRKTAARPVLTKPAHIQRLDLEARRVFSQEARCTKLVVIPGQFRTVLHVKLFLRGYGINLVVRLLEVRGREMILGAHPNRYTSSFLFDLESGQFINPIQIAENPESFRTGAADLILSRRTKKRKTRKRRTCGVRLFCYYSVITLC